MQTRFPVPQSALTRRHLMAAGAASAISYALPAPAQSKTVLRVSSPAVPDDWHA
jgi:hypothetical protein